MDSNNRDIISVKIVTKSELITKERVINAEVSVSLYSVLFKSFERLIGTGINCETALFLFIVKYYKNQEFEFNIRYRKDFIEFCKLYNIREFKEISLKKGMTKLYNQEVINKISRGKYQLNTDLNLI